MFKRSKKTTGFTFESIAEKGIILGIAYLLIIRFLLIFSYSTDLEGLENVSIHFIQLLKTKHHLYSDPTDYPFLLLVYTPLYHYLIAGISSLLSLDILNDPHQLYILSRTLSFALLFVDFYLLVKIARSLIPDFRLSSIWILIFLLLTPKHFYTCRPDSFKVTCFLLFLFYQIRHIKTGARWDFSLAFIFLLFGILFKQDLIIYGTAFYGILFLIYKRPIYAAGPFILMAILLLTIYFMYLTTGINLVKNLFILNLQYNSGLHLSYLIITVNVIRLLPLTYFTYRNFYSKEKTIRTLAILSLIFLVLSNLSMLRVGSNTNYAYESVILLLINAFLFQKEHSDSGLKRAMIGYVVFLLLFLGKLNLYAYQYDKSAETINKKEYVSTINNFKKIKEIVKKDVVFFPNMKYTIFMPEKNLIYGYDWHYDRFTEIYLDLDMKRIKYYPVMKSKFVANDITKKYDESFSNGIVPYIIISNEQRSLEQMRKYYQKYTLAYRIENFLIYKYQKQSING